MKLTKKCKQKALGKLNSDKKVRNAMRERLKEFHKNIYALRRENEIRYILNCLASFYYAF